MGLRTVRFRLPRWPSTVVPWSKRIEWIDDRIYLPKIRVRTFYRQREGPWHRCKILPLSLYNLLFFMFHNRRFPEGVLRVDLEYTSWHCVPVEMDVFTDPWPHDINGTSDISYLSVPSYTTSLTNNSVRHQNVQKNQ